MTIVAVLVPVLTAIALFFSLSASPTASEPKSVLQTVAPDGMKRLKPRSDLATDRELLLAIKSRVSSLDKRLQLLEQRPIEPPALPTPPPLTVEILPQQLPDGSDAPWAWIEKLDPLKQAAVERAFNDAAAALRASIPEENGLDDAKLEVSMAQLEQDVARRLKSILSAQEFEAYLLSLPDDALERLGFEKSGN